MIKAKIFHKKEYSIEQRERIHQLLGLSNNTFNGVCIQTCNRLELYRGEGEISEQSIRHLYRVVSGLESGLLGDMSIQGQVRIAYKEAQERTKLSSEIHKLFQSALAVGKMVRNQTMISKGAMSHSQAAVDIILDHPVPAHSRITVIGAHNINENIIKYLVKKGMNTLFIGNRTHAKAKDIANKYNCNVFRFEDIKMQLLQTDVLVTATSAPHFVVKKEDFPSDVNMMIIDLAVPRDVHPSIGDLDGVTLFNLDQVEKRVDNNRGKRIAEIDKAEEIIEEQIVEFFIAMKRRAHYLKKRN